jgi:IclR family transcriptional regulator, mhp operon transcriptional activator
MARLVQSIQRCLAILEYLNIRDGASLHDVCQETGLTRGTVYRVLETLRQEKFLRKDKGSPRYWLAGRVRVLSDGYKEEWWIEEFAAEIIEKLGKETRWPVKFLTPSGHELITRVTTDFDSPFTDGKFPTGFRVSLAFTAAGRAYLAFADEGTRAILLKAAASAPPPRRNARWQSRHKNFAGLDKVLTRVREQGFHIVDQEETNFFSMAVPVLVHDRPIGSIAIFFFRAAVTHNEATKTFLPLLQRAAQEIGDKYARIQA